MTIRDALKNADLASLESEILMAHVLGISRTDVLARSYDELSDEHISMFRTYLSDRSSGKPIAYITGTKEFYGRDFLVNQHVLIPRPATEVLIDVALETIRSRQETRRDADTKIIALSKIYREWSDDLTLVDIGTGSGIIAITLALETQCSIIATDVSLAALDVARKNAEHHHVSDRITFLHGDSLEPLHTFHRPFFIVTNPPYIPDTTMLESDVQNFEPHEAVFAGKDGMSVIRPLIKQCKDNQYCVGIAIECMDEQIQE